MRLSDRALNRTLWVRQHLVPGHGPCHADDPVGLVRHLLGLQAQESRSPYLSLAARIPCFDPTALSDALEDRRLVRLLTMRGTVHVLDPEDAAALRAWTQPMLDRLSRTNQVSRPARDITSDDLVAAATAALAGGSLPVADLGSRLAETWPEVPEAALRNAVRERVPMVQVPPRGLWRRSGGVVYQLLSTYVDGGGAEPDVRDLVRRYLRAYGPASPADMTAWSGVTRLKPVFAAMADELVTYETESGRTLHDVPDGVVADAGLDLPPVLLGTYDNLWLSHADRTRIASDDNRRGWMGPSGGIGAGVFVDGMLEGWWHGDAAGIEITACRTFTAAERRGLDAEVTRVRELLAR